MVDPSQSNPGPSPDTSGTEPRRSGSVKKAREMLEAGVRPTRTAPPMPRPPPPPPPVRQVAHQSQWPLPASGLQPRPLNPQHPRFLAPRGPPPLRPPRPSEVPSQIPSPSVYSVRSGEAPPSVNINPNPYPYPTRQARSFSHPNPHHQSQLPRPSTSDGSTSPTSTVDLNPRISITTDDLFRHSTYSAASSIPAMAPIPPREPPLPPAQPRRPPGGLNAGPPGARSSRARRSSVSPIPEEIPDPRHTLGSFASSRAIPYSWGSGPPQSDILEGYLDDESSEESSDEEDEQETQAERQEEDAYPVRSASVGKRQRPTMRTIMKSNPASEVSIPDMPDLTPAHTTEESIRDSHVTGTATTATVGVLRVVNATPTPTRTEIRTPSPVRRGSISSLSGESCVDPEKPRFAKQEDHTFRGALEKEIEALPLAAPTMSDKRPNGRKPPRLDMNAVRDAEQRGSLSSLSDLIRRATRLASNLDRGKTASRADLVGADMRQIGHRPRNSGSLSDILASFPNPTPDGHSSWPVFFGRSNLRNVEPLASHDDNPETAPKPARRCCGLPRKWFIILCILIFIIVVLAILLPVFLVAVPAQNAADKSCSHTTPCQNGGVSVSSGSECSCVCAEGYMGVQCSVVGDSICVTAEVNNGSIDKNATMGSSIPTLLAQSDSKFGIELDAVTIMALFSLNNVTCSSENKLVAFSEVDRSSSSSDNARRAILVETDTPESSDEKVTRTPSKVAGLNGVSHVEHARAMKTSNGILYDSGTGTSSSSTADESTATTTSSSTATTTGTGATATATATSVPSGVVEFSQVAVLYILEKTGSMSMAQQSESEIQDYLVDGYNSASHPTVEVLGWYGIDFSNKTITAG
ncbi:hypothetical protein N7466_006132 [Penicillium verhagenii]|uniref:uncharacterized protein n=1 Tax=Penicillium verhagenii TaxID=1562060 RepID=UPI0025458081|nr:uncharacterized protein N7466_006132 [Penicillium verhagenii]KAJ5930639.1 hypothetical protein N7466_006132 [Penicillium verhagenii]